MKQIRTDKAEAHLEALIAECHQIIHDLVVPAAAAAKTDHDRRFILLSGMDVIRAGAAVGDTVARLRAGGAVEHRQRITVERIDTQSTTDGEGG